MQLDFHGKVALVTGASRGIGRRIAEDLRDCGARLIVTSTRNDHRDELIDTLGADTIHYAVDFLDAARTRDFLGELRTLSPVHVCINNAGTTRHGRYDTMTESDWDDTNEVNLKAPYFVAQAVAGAMKEQQYGRIVNISSIWGHIGRLERSVYAATKFGLRGLTVGYALELARYNVLVNVVSPGFTETDMARQNYSPAELAELSARVPMGRLATPADISRTVLFLASDLNSYVTGQSVIVDGGYSCV